MADAGIVESARHITRQAVQASRGGPAEAKLGEVLARLDAPLRVAIAGKVKTGKSTLLNALVGEQLAPTDAGECTKIVTWYQEGLTYKVRGEMLDGSAVELPFARDGGPIDVDLCGRSSADLSRLLVEWPSGRLASMTLIDTPGLESLSDDVSARTTGFLTPGEAEPRATDAVVYLMRHVHTGDVRFLEAFHDDEQAKATPINAIGVLSRADEIGVGRVDSLESARRIARKYRREPTLRRLVQTVVPVAGLLAQAGTTLREVEFRVLGAIAEAPRVDAEDLLLSVDRFATGETPIDLLEEERAHLLDRLGMFGIRLAVMLIRKGQVGNATELARELVARSGLDELQDVLGTQFAARAGLLKARSALLTVEAALTQGALADPDVIGAELERVFASAHEFTEVRLLNVLRSGNVALSETELADAEVLLGTSGSDPRSRLGLDTGAAPDEIRAAALEELARWQRSAENPMSSRETADAARVLVRTCEGLLTD